MRCELCGFLEPWGRVMEVERKVMDDVEAFLDGGSMLLAWLDTVSSELDALASLAISASCSGFLPTTELPFGGILLIVPRSWLLAPLRRSADSSGLIDRGMSSRASFSERSECRPG